MSVEYQRLSTDRFPDDVDVLPANSVFNGATMVDDVTDIADYVVIGSGAAGGTSAKVLSSAGYSVIIIEEGPWVRTRNFSEDVYPAMKTMFREMGTNMTMGRAAMPVMQGRCVGGSTTINSAIAWRVPGNVVDRWNTDFGLKGTITNKELEPHFDELDRTLIVQPVADKALGRNNSIFAEAALRLGIQAERIKRYDAGCKASASCLTGCRSGKKFSMNLTFIPQSLHRGARLYTSTRARKIKFRYGRANQVQAVFQAPGAPKLTVHARRGVVVAASAVQTPGILKRSGIKLDALGRHFQAHPGTSLPALFDHDISMQIGATQGFNSLHFVDSGHFKIETLSLPPELLAVRLPGVGPEFMKKLLNYRYASNWALVVRAEAEGQIRSLFGRDIVQYSPSTSDVAKMRHGLRIISEMMFVAGAKEVWPSVTGMPILKSLDDLHYWDDAPLDPRAYGTMISHLFGSARMGSDSRSSVVGLDFQVHGTRGLYVMDSSLFPTNIGVNPQHTIMAVAHLGTTRIVERPLPCM